MITATLTNDMTTYQLPPIEKDFIHKPIENATDVVTLDGNMYTDFVNQKSSWTFNYDSLTEEQYNDIREFYDTQFLLFDYPRLSIPYYSLSDRRVRMYINDKNIWNNCGSVQNVQLIFRETDELPEGSSGSSGSS